MQSDIKFLNALNTIPGVGPTTLRLLKNHFGSYRDAWQATEAELARASLNNEAARAIVWKKPSIQPDKEMEKLVREDVWLIAEGDPAYPAELQEIPSPPVLIYGKGGQDLHSRDSEKQTPVVAVVGTRKPTAYGLEATELITKELAEVGVTIVSGLARGIDTRAHETTLEFGGKTIAILGSGIDQNSVFPPENRGLVRRILEHGGTVLSEYAPGTPPFKENFPQRNRIISGLSRGVLIIEAREKSGALITARLALEQNREVFALPGSIFSTTSSGPHKLIQEGAKLVTCAKDILETLGLEYTEIRKNKTEASLEEKEKTLLALLEEPLHIDLVKEKSQLETPVVITTLSLLELKGLVRNLGGDTYQKT